MKLYGEALRFSPSDLGHFVGCEHLTQLEVAAARGEIAKPHYVNAFDDLRKRKGEEHEAAFVHALLAQGREVVTIELGEERDFEEAAARTVAAMRAGAEYVYQAVLVLDGWRGIADFLERVERPSALGPWSYEVLDTKLARHARPSHALQLCFYSEAVAAVQGLAPDHAAVVLGTSERHVLRLADVEAYYRRLRRRFRDAVGRRPATQPYRCDHCRICDWRPRCNDWWEERDHLVRVAGMRRDQIERFAEAGIGTLTALAEAAPRTAVRKLQPDTFEALREQAELQLHRTRTGELVHRLRPVETGRGFEALPPPSEGDVVFDFEGDMFFEPARGLEFLFGLLLREDGDWRYEAIWAHDRESEREALERFVDLVHARLARWPDLHVYHYAFYEPTAVKRLMGEYGTREHEVDALLRGGVFVDLYTTVRQALRAGVPGYGLKEVEALAGFVRAASVGSGDEAVVDYERWRETGDAALLERIAAYNEEDCRATLALRDWLLGVRPPDIAWPEPTAAAEVSEEKQEAIAERAHVREALLAFGEGTPQALAGELLEYHRREARPGWWRFFARLLDVARGARRGGRGGRLPRAGRRAGGDGKIARLAASLPRAGRSPLGRRQRHRSGNGSGSRRARRAGSRRVHAAAQARAESRGGAVAPGARRRRAVRHRDAAGRSPARRQGSPRGRLRTVSGSRPPARARAASRDRPPCGRARADDRPRGAAGPRGRRSTRATSSSRARPERARRGAARG